MRSGSRTEPPSPRCTRESSRATSSASSSASRVAARSSRSPATASTTRRRCAAPTSASRWDSPERRRREKHPMSCSPTTTSRRSSPRCAKDAGSATTCAPSSTSFSANAGEVALFAIAILAGLGAPMTVVQVLMVNLLTDGLPAIALGSRPGLVRHDASSAREPRHLLGRELTLALAVAGLAVGLAATGAFLLGRELDSGAGQTMAFATIALAELVLVFASARPHDLRGGGVGTTHLSCHGRLSDGRRRSNLLPLGGDLVGPEALGPLKWCRARARARAALLIVNAEAGPRGSAKHEQQQPVAPIKANTGRRRRSPSANRVSGPSFTRRALGEHPLFAHKPSQQHFHGGRPPCQVLAEVGGAGICRSRRSRRAGDREDMAQDSRTRLTARSRRPSLRRWRKRRRRTDRRRRRARGPRAASRAAAHAAGRVRWHGEAIREIVLAGLAALAYFGVRNLTAGSAATAFANADRIMRFEDATHLDWERSLQTRIAGSATLTDLVNWVYIWGHWPVIRHGGDRPLPTSPRALSAPAQRDPDLRRDRLRPLRALPCRAPAACRPRASSTPSLSTRTRTARSNRPGSPNQYAAFPSLHFGWNLRRGRRGLGRHQEPRRAHAGRDRSRRDGGGGRPHRESLRRRRSRRLSGRVHRAGCPSTVCEPGTRLDL